MVATTANMIACRPMSPDEIAFFQAMGGRIATARKDADLTQVELADRLGIAQQQLASYEIGRRRVPLSLMPKLARALSVSIEELIGEESPQSAPTRRGPPSRIQMQLERIQALPRARQRFLSDMIETALQHGGNANIAEAGS
jgi:transcriptional regulator with XRE-family HTH domain